MLEIKAESPKLDTVQYYWLDDLVGHIEFKQDTMRVFWKCGLESEVALNASKVEEPTHVAELYRNSLDRAQRSENKPVSVVRGMRSKGILWMLPCWKPTTPLKSRKRSGR